jgi:MFS family permease
MLATLVAEAGPDGARRRLALVLVLVVAINAAGAMIVEIVAGRLLAPYFGMSLYTWTTVIGVVLTGLAIGHWAGGRLADAYPRHRAGLLGLACLGGAATTILVLPLVGIAAGVLEAVGVPTAVAVVLTGFLAFLVPSVTAGLVQPIATTYGLAALGAAAGRIVGRMLAAGVVGAIIGTFLAGFVLIAYLGTAGAIWLVAGLNGLLAALLLGAARLRLAGLVVLAVGAGFAATGTSLPGFAAPCQHESQYYCIGVFPGDAVGLADARLMRLDALSHSVNSADPARLEYSHLQFVDELVRRRFGERAFASFFIGGGGYTLPRAWLARNPQNAVTVAELDPLVTRIARAEMWFEPGPATRILDADARVALRRLVDGQTFDVIVGDAFRDIALPPHLVTDEFHAVLRARLAAVGFYVMNVIDAVEGQALVGSIVATLRQRFAVVETWVETEEFSSAPFANFVVYASREPSSLASPFISESAPFRRFRRVDPVADAAVTLVLTDDFAPVERLLLNHWFFGG